MFTVLGARRILKTMPPSPEPDLQHGLFVRTQIDAGLLIDEGAKPVEICVGEILCTRSHSCIPTAEKGRVGRRECIAGQATSDVRTADKSSAEKTRSMSRIMMNCESRLPMPLMKSVRIWVPILGAGWI